MGKIAGKDIINWLEGDRSYSQGVALYGIYGGSNNLKRLFTKKEMPEKLLYELEKIVRHLGLPRVKTRAKTKVVKATITKDAPGYISNKELNSGAMSDPMYIDLTKQMQRLLDERRIRHNSLFSCTSDKDRHEAAIKIVMLTREINSVDDKRQYFKAHGRLPEISISEMDPLQMANRIRNLEVYIRRERNDPTKADKLQLWIEEKDELKLRLKNAVKS